MVIQVGDRLGNQTLQGWVESHGNVQVRHLPVTFDVGKCSDFLVDFNRADIRGISRVGGKKDLSDFSCRSVGAAESTFRDQLSIGDGIGEICFLQADALDIQIGQRQKLLRLADAVTTDVLPDF